MKEAAGEANLTVVAIILIGIVLAVATPLIKNLTDTAAKRSCCVERGGTFESGTCKIGNTAVTDYWNSSTKSCN